MTKMNQKTRITYAFHSLLYLVVFFSTLFTGANLVFPDLAIAASAAEIDRDVEAALKDLYVSSPAAKDLSTTAKAILVFPQRKVRLKPI